MGHVLSGESPEDQRSKIRPISTTHSVKTLYLTGNHELQAVCVQVDESAVNSRGGEKNRFFDLSRFSLERLSRFRKVHNRFFFFKHPFCVEMQAASIIALFIESHNCDKEKLFL